MSHASEVQRANEAIAGLTIAGRVPLIRYAPWTGTYWADEKDFHRTSYADNAPVLTFVGGASHWSEKWDEVIFKTVDRLIDLIREHSDQQDPALLAFDRLDQEE